MRWVAAMSTENGRKMETTVFRVEFELVGQDSVSSQGSVLVQAAGA